MRIVILGTRGEIEEKSPTHSKHSGVLIDNILFDIGEKEYLDLKPKAIFITHLHPDHAYFVKSKEAPELVGIPVYAPEKWEGFTKEHVFIQLKKGKAVKVNGLSVTPIPTIHSKKVKSCGFLIEFDKKRIFYSGDMIWIRKQYHRLLNNLDLVITDGSFSRKGGMIRRDKETGEIYGHQGIPNLVEFWKKLGAKHIVFTHFGTWMIEDPAKGKQQIKEFSSDTTKVEAASDGMVIDLEVGSSLGTTTTEAIEPITPKVIAKLQPKAGLYLVKPHAQLIAEGKKTLIVKSKKFTSHIGEPLFLLEDKLCWGIITLKEPYEISFEEFVKLRDRHQISDEEAFKRWGWKKDAPLYAYEFEIEEIFDPPIPVKIPKGVQVFVDAKNIKFVDLKTLTILDLFDFADYTLDPELYAMIAEELFDRNLYYSQVFCLIKGWIEDYDPTKPNDRQLGDDFRIVLAWYSSIRRGKKLFKRVGEEKKEITLDDCKQLALKIFKEMIKRGFTFNRPETYKKYARELFEWLIEQVGEENVPWKDKEENAKTVPDIDTLDIKDLEDIDDVYVKQLTDEQLIKLHEKLHQLFKKLGKVTEPLQNAHIFVWNEMRYRKLQHFIEDDLDRETSLEVVEYPEPEEGVPQKISKETLEATIKLEEALKAFPDKIVVEDPIHVYLCGRIVNEGQIPASHDIDILFKQGWYHVPTINAFLDQIAKNDPEIARRLHFVWDPLGPHIGYTVPLYRLAFLKVSPEEMKRTSPFAFLAETPTLFKPYVGLKPKSGFEKNEFWDINEMWEKWAKNYIDKGIIIQKKYDGMRFQVHCKGNQIKIITEDRQRDRAFVFKKSVEELLKNKKADSFIIDAEMVEYACTKPTNRPDLCEPIPRENMIKWIGAEKKELDDEYVVFHVHDCVYINGEAINMKGYEERWAAIDKIIPPNLKHWRKVEGEIARDMRSFFRLAKKYRSLPGSEGIVAKAVGSTYPIKYSGENRTAEWAKLKNLKEIDVMVWKVIQKKTKEGKPLPQYMYECVFAIPCKDKDKYRERDLVEIGGKCYLWIGRTYATSEKVSPGTIIVVRPIRIAKFTDERGKIYYTWMFPYYDGKHPSKTEPDSIDVVEKLVRIGTGPAPEQLGTLVFRLPECPFWNDDNICPLKHRFRIPRDLLTKVKIEYLKYPIVCRFANHYRCRFVKSYYYGFLEGEVKEVDEDTGEETNENN